MRFITKVSRRLINSCYQPWKDGRVWSIWMKLCITTLLNNRPQPCQNTLSFSHGNKSIGLQIGNKLIILKSMSRKIHILMTSIYSACAHTMAWEFKSPALCPQKWNFCNKDSSVSQNIKFLGQIKNPPSSRTAAIFTVPLLIFISWYWWLQHLSSQRVCIILFTANPFSNHTWSEKGGVKTCCVLKKENKNQKIMFILNHRCKQRKKRKS